ncbi:hypothetical protein FC78_GL001175 [Companilactobacillus bobalius DSM 19674]|uniref:Uncharacterized protein n=1 Tax=Companilactobacillus bobalius DSM 19674 TaxID=1423788 RepID=A0A0R1KNS8_9LACO|nr:hypothetical protein FC78_GL001175 [Companilactobacillus bobalius DSM 19674]
MSKELILPEERRILKTLNKKFKNPNVKYMTYEELNVERQDYYLNYLRHRKLVKTVDYPDSDLLDHRSIGIAPTIEGKHYFEWTSEKFKKILINSVALPIAVTIITNILIKIFSFLFK